MFYFTFVFLFASVFLLIKDREGKSTRYMIYIMASYTVALYSMMFYLSKDTYYYNTVFNYFSLPSYIWKVMMFANVSRELLIVVMNLSSLAVIYFGLGFSFAFQVFENSRCVFAIKMTALVILLIEFIFYLPDLTRIIYINLYPYYLSYEALTYIKMIFHRTTVIINALIIMASIVTIVISYRKASPLRMIRLNIFAIGLCYTMIMISYLFIFGTCPQILIKVSKIADSVTFLSMPINRNSIVHVIFPYYLIGTFLLIVFSLYRYINVNHKIDMQTFSLSKEIAASDTISNVFCHYMKNELLAIQSEVEMIQTDGENKDIQANVTERCDNLYRRLDSIHKSTKTSELYLTETNLYQYIQQCLNNLSGELRGYHVELNSEVPSLTVMLDTNYFEQALHNIFTNAIDAMKDLPDERKNLTITIKSVSNWAAIFISDTGRGIPGQDVDKIFDPFFSSAPVSKHWGMGLTLTHKIITAHEGYIEVESNEGAGTVMKIMLPSLIGVRS